MGDFCAKDDILVLIETDKVTIEAGPIGVPSGIKKWYPVEETLLSFFEPLIAMCRDLIRILTLFGGA